MSAGFHVVQYGAPGSPEAGTALVSRWPLTRPRRVLGSRRTRETRARSWVGAKVLGRKVWSGHANPPRDPAGAARYIARARMLRGGLGADWNHAPRWMHATSVRRYVGDGVLGVLVPRWWKPRLIGTVDIGSDHRAVDIEVRWGVRKVILRVANCAAVSNPNGAHRCVTLAIERPTAEWLRPEVWFLSEVSPVDVAGMLED